MVGHVSKAHGVKGELVVSALTDHPEGVFVPGVELHPAGSEGQAPDHDLPRLTVEAVRPFRRGFLVRFRGLVDRTFAEQFRGRYLLLPLDEVPEREEGELFYHELLGMEVVTAGGERVGTVREVYDLSPTHLLEVLGGERKHLIPLSRDVVEAVESEPPPGRIVIDPPEGLLDL